MNSPLKLYSSNLMQADNCARSQGCPLAGGLTVLGLQPRSQGLYSSREGGEDSPWVKIACFVLSYVFSLCVSWGWDSVEIKNQYDLWRVLSRQLDNSQFFFHRALRYWRSLLRWKSSSLSTRAIHRDLRPNWWTECRYYLYTHHSYSCPHVFHHYLTPRQKWSPVHLYPI